MGRPPLVTGAGVAAVVWLVGAVMGALAIWPRRWGSAGDRPQRWYRFVEDPNVRLARMLSISIAFAGNAVLVAYRRNAVATRWIRIAFWVVVAAPWVGAAAAAILAFR